MLCAWLTALASEPARTTSLALGVASLDATPTSRSSKFAQVHIISIQNRHCI